MLFEQLNQPQYDFLGTEIPKKVRIVSFLDLLALLRSFEYSGAALPDTVGPERIGLGTQSNVMNCECAWKIITSLSRTTSLRVYSLPAAVYIHLDSP